MESRGQSRTELTVLTSLLSLLLSLPVLPHPHPTRNLMPCLLMTFPRGSCEHSGDMRQLKGKPKKETSKDKKERKQAMQEARQQVATVVLPTLAVVVLLIVVFVYVATRPGAIVDI
ncbi:single-pass membrane and coiled-coil domain-containing protein 4 [Amphiprion ocellaris]|nr:single-pass membrane and coiled-coil domain-containing protein 4 [Amphiprion ocellaris]